MKEEILTVTVIFLLLGVLIICLAILLEDWLEPQFYDSWVFPFLSFTGFFVMGFGGFMQIIRKEAQDHLWHFRGPIAVVYGLISIVPFWGMAFFVLYHWVKGFF
ncbi:MAG TPA: hypothetical protein VFF68_03350 [Anaerolineaceae bacterium]|nr:hypothetical protein [Anaerolineaceae bacterium]